MQFNTIKINRNIKNLLITPFPEYIRKKKGTKNNAPTYVSGYPVIDKLNATFGFAGWSWDIVKEWIEASTDKVIKTRYENGRVINLQKEEWYVEQQDPVVHIIGKLTVYFEKEDGTIHTIHRMAPGAQPIVGGQETQENAFKSAHTDALKKAATLFGIGLELYRDTNEQTYYNEINYEDPWNEETLEIYKDELKFIRDYKTDFSISDEKMDQYMDDFSDGVYPTMDYLLPDNIVDFVEYLKK